ncbi:Rna (guanine-9-)-methyltransferase domain-containing protein 2 [Oopsacas minuta]|uniref:tRNA (guanine(9)-N(1))-methyltransferase n=1 Tax=Oopsacas minuta TaxID=111878 RepID=A0AAV7KIA2_9METZ|nr:Rna (guanine-9-)-methyltransferase domain-containing protein 2 [Oopsacas minuta]
MIRHSICIINGVQLNNSRFLSTINTDVTATKPSDNSTIDLPDYRILPEDASRIPINSPYYLYNVDPAQMSKNFMKGVFNFHRKKLLRKEKYDKLALESNEATDLASQPTKEKKRRLFRYNLLDCNALPHRIAIDYSYSHLMTSIEMSQNAKQMLHILKSNSISPTPVQLHITNYQGCIRDHLLHRGKKLREDSVHVSSLYLTEVFNRKEIVYLSGDSDNVLETIDPSLVYVIGGLVDSRRNIKGASLTAAIDAGVRHARLPLDEYIIQDMPRPIPVNQIFYMLSKFILCNSWLHAISSTIPPKRIVAVRVRAPLGTHKPTLYN